MKGAGCGDWVPSLLCTFGPSEAAAAQGDLQAPRPGAEGKERSSSLSFCRLVLVQQSAVNNNLNALVVSHCSFFVNVTHFINKSKPADLGFSET